jgi:geranylgeranyl diphosphate synthase type II
MTDSEAPLYGLGPSLTQALDRELAAALERHLKARDGAAPGRLADSVRYSLLGPGKRIRPRLTLACGQMLGLPRGAALPPALALEMIHCFTLIHDDLPCLDDDDVRRGRPSNHRQFDEATALLAGDGLIGLAIDTLLEAFPPAPAERVLAAVRRLSWAMGVRGVIGGQAAESLLDERSTLEDLRAMHAGKTGALFSASLLLPRDLAGLDPFSAPAKALERFAAQLGLAFQAVDDLEDAGQDAAQAGSRRASHAGRDHANILRYLSPERVRDSARRELQLAAQALEAAFGPPARPLLDISHEVLARLGGAAGAGGAPA